MTRAFIHILLLLLGTMTCGAAYAGGSIAEAEEPENGTVITLWPLVDYRESPADRYRNLGILGPLLKFQTWDTTHETAVRPFVYRTEDTRNATVAGEYLYPLASTESTPEIDTFQVAKLFQLNEFRRNEPDSEERSSMLFPFYISGTSKKYGPYTSVFPFYGDLYERFWRDEYHYVMFPLYGRTVRKGTTTRNYLYPFFATIEGEKERGFQFWPLYGEASKEGSYARRFVAWPFFFQEKSGLDGDNPTESLYLLPLYAATDSPKSHSRYLPWPFVGYRSSTNPAEEERDYFWPLLRTVRGEKRQITSWLPFYLEETRPEYRKQWYLWPIYRTDAIDSPTFRQERQRVLYFLYSDNRENWPEDGAERRRTALWPLFLYGRDTRGISSLSLPAPVEPILDREGIERNWAPLWRLYQQKWDDKGYSAVSLLWNLYWHDRQPGSMAYELFPLVAGRSEEDRSDLQLFKGLVRYQRQGASRQLNLFWFPYGITWGDDRGSDERTARGGNGSGGV